MQVFLKESLILLVISFTRVRCVVSLSYDMYECINLKKHVYVAFVRIFVFLI